MDPAALNSVTSDGALVSALLNLFNQDPTQQKFILKDCRELDKKKPPKPHVRIGFYDQINIIANTTEIMGPQWPLHTPEFWDKALDNVFCTALRTAPTLGEALDITSQYGFLWSPFLVFEKYIGPNEKVITIDAINPGGLEPKLEAALVTLKNMSLFAVYMVLDETLKSRWNGALISIDAPISKPQNYEKFFATGIKFNTPRLALKLPVKLYQKKSQMSDAARFRKACLQIQNFAYPPDLDEVAKTVGMSTRTLNRRLEKMGVSFRDILERSLQNRTQVLLRQGQLSRGEIAERLGYKDQASFSRALRRWHTE